MKIAIIGTGVSGLLTAYLLKQKQPQTSITLFEKSNCIGGNVHTNQVQIGRENDPLSQRWADLGVNDFNLVTYQNIAALLDKLQVPYRPLEKSTSFSTQDGAISYVMEAEAKAMGLNSIPLSAAIQKGIDNFRRQAPLDLKDPFFFSYSVADYIQYRNTHNPDNDPHFYPEEFVQYHWLPRINAMYFVHDTGPESMSFVAVMGYYTLQEGIGGRSPKRVYIEGGTQTWIAALYARLLAQGVSVVFNADIQVFGQAHGVKLMNHNDTLEPFDAAVMACHASTVLKLIRQGVTQEMVTVLSQFENYNSVAVAHTYARLLPPDRKLWRTYNILIHKYQNQLHPYTISYVCNRHQNDRVNPAYKNRQVPDFFVTLNPVIPIPERYVLLQPNGLPAIAHFSHNVVNVATLKAQQALWSKGKSRIQGTNNIYFAGGWTVGTGLHEECYQSAEQVVDRILENLFHRMETPNNENDTDASKSILRLPAYHH